MSWIDRFRGGKKRHRRGHPTEDATDTDGFTREIARPSGGRHASGSDPAGGWDDERPPPEPARDDAVDAPTVEAMRPVAPPPRPSPARPPPTPIPRTPTPAVVDSEDDHTVLASQASVAKGRVVAVLLGVEGPLEGQVVRVYEGENLIGREGQPDPLPNTPEAKTISRKHALLTAEGGYFAIESVEAHNATCVNEKLIDARELIQHGDRVKLGSARPSTFVLLVVP